MMTSFDLALLDLSTVQLHALAVGAADVRDRSIERGDVALAEVWNELLIAVLGTRDRLLLAQAAIDNALITANDPPTTGSTTGVQ